MRRIKNSYFLKLFFFRRFDCEITKWWQKTLKYVFWLKTKNRGLHTRFILARVKGTEPLMRWSDPPNPSQQCGSSRRRITLSVDALLEPNDNVNLTWVVGIYFCTFRVHVHTFFTFTWAACDTSIPLFIRPEWIQIDTTRCKVWNHPAGWAADLILSYLPFYCYAALFWCIQLSCAEKIIV